MAVLVDHVCLSIRHELHKPVIEVYFPKIHMYVTTAVVISKGGGRMILLPEHRRSRDYICIIERDRWDFLQEATLSDCVVQD